MTSRKHEVLLRIRQFKPKELVFDEVNILGLKLVDEKWDKVFIDIDEGEDIEAKINALINDILGKYSNEKELFVEVEASIPGLTIKRGEGDYTGRIIVLSPKPVRVFKIGIVPGEPTSNVLRKLDLSEEKTSTMQVVVSEHLVESEEKEKIPDTNNTTVQESTEEYILDPEKAIWYNIEDDVYVYEGFIITKKAWKAIIFVTDDGTRILLPGDFETKTIASEYKATRKTKKKRRKRKSSKTKKTKKKRKTRKKKG